MKRMVIISMILLFFTLGCQGKYLKIATENENAIAVVTGITAREIGCEVAWIEDAKASQEVDRALRNFYDLAKSGNLPDDAIDQLNDTLRSHNVDRPTLIDNVVDLMGLINVEYVGEEIPEEVKAFIDKLFTAIEKGYLGGVKRCQIQRE